MNPPLLRVRDLAVHFPVGRRGLLGRPARWLRAVDGVSFDLERGESLGLVGESGCGKSTTARAIVGLQRATAGSVQLDGVELCGLVGFIYSLPSVPALLSCPLRRVSTSSANTTHRVVSGLLLEAIHHVLPVALEDRPAVWFLRR